MQAPWDYVRDHDTNLGRLLRADVFRQIPGSFQARRKTMSIARIEVITDQRGNIVAATDASPGKRSNSSAGLLPGPDADHQAFVVYVSRERQGLLIRDQVANCAVSGTEKRA